MDGPPELAPNCEALISKLKRIEREPIRTPRIQCGGVLRRSQPQANVLTFRAYTDSVHAVVWLPDGKHIASASGDGSVQVWQAVYI